MDNIRYILAKSVTDGHTELLSTWDFEGVEYVRERLRLNGLSILRIYDEHEYDALWNVDSEDLDSNGKAVLEYVMDNVIHNLNNFENDSEPNGAGRKFGRGNSRLGMKAAIAIALVAAFAIGTFVGYGVSSFGVW